jgi:hypothetical protein
MKMVVERVPVGFATRQHNLDATAASLLAEEIDTGTGHPVYLIEQNQSHAAESVDSCTECIRELAAVLHAQLRT